MLDNRVPGFERLRVLLVEDGLFARRLARSVMNQLGIDKITIVEDGRAAIELVTRQGDERQFDLIVSDWNMPNASGLQVLRHVRQTWENMPFLMLTGNANEDFVRAAQANKVDAYVIKPFSPAQLRQKICVLFNIPMES